VADHTQEFQFVKEWLEAEDRAGRQYGSLLLGMATGLWRSEMNRDENLRRYGTLRFLLGVIRSDLFQYPLQARERAAVVIEYTEEVDVPSEQCFHFLGGLAWKEYANALRYTGEFPLALDAARKSRAIFGMAGSLACDAAKAHLVEALSIESWATSIRYWPLQPSAKGSFAILRMPRRTCMHG
jgi:hypothetical protein